MSFIESEKLKPSLIFNKDSNILIIIDDTSSEQALQLSFIWYDKFLIEGFKYIQNFSVAMGIYSEINNLKKLKHQLSDKLSVLQDTEIVRYKELLRENPKNLLGILKESSEKKRLVCFFLTDKDIIPVHKMAKENNINVTFLPIWLNGYKDPECSKDPSLNTDILPLLHTSHRISQYITQCFEEYTTWKNSLEKIIESPNMIALKFKKPKNADDDPKKVIIEYEIRYKAEFESEFVKVKDKNFKNYGDYTICIVEELKPDTGYFFEYRKIYSVSNWILHPTRLVTKHVKNWDPFNQKLDDHIKSLKDQFHKEIYGGDSKDRQINLLLLDFTVKSFKENFFEESLNALFGPNLKPKDLKNGMHCYTLPKYENINILDPVFYHNKDFDLYDTISSKGEMERDEIVDRLKTNNILNAESGKLSDKKITTIKIHGVITIINEVCLDCSSAFPRNSSCSRCKNVSYFLYKFKDLPRITYLYQDFTPSLNIDIDFLMQSIEVPEKILFAANVRRLGVVERIYPIPQSKNNQDLRQFSFLQGMVSIIQSALNEIEVRMTCVEIWANDEFLEPIDVKDLKMNLYKFRLLLEKEFEVFTKDLYFFKDLNGMELTTDDEHNKCLEDIAIDEYLNVKTSKKFKIRLYKA